jgi:hypothetical protein
MLLKQEVISDLFQQERMIICYSSPVTNSHYLHSNRVGAAEYEANLKQLVEPRFLYLGGLVAIMLFPQSFTLMIRSGFPTSALKPPSASLTGGSGPPTIS